MSSSASASPSPRFRIGTSGYNYSEWKGSFYPEKLAARKMLPYYAQRLETVEINYTFYRLPTERVLAGWSEVTPPGFTFTLKAPRRITHEARLRGCEEVTGAFCGAAASLDSKLGALLFQLPPYFRKDLPVLDAFLGMLPSGARAAFEFRHRSWHDDDVFERLAAAGQALCVADSERLSTPVRITAGFAYFRLRDEGYTDADVVRWAETIAGATTACDEVFVYFKHEESGKGPALARRLTEALGLPVPTPDEDRGR